MSSELSPISYSRSCPVESVKRESSQEDWSLPAEMREAVSMSNLTSLPASAEPVLPKVSGVR